MVFSILVLAVAVHFLMETITYREYFLDLENRALTMSAGRLGYISRRSFPFSTLRKVVIKGISKREDAYYTLTVTGETKHFIGSWTNVDEARARGTKIAESAGITIEDCSG